MGTKLKRTWAAGESEDGLVVEIGQQALDWVWSLSIEHRDSVPCLETESGCSGQHSASSVQEALISFPTVFCPTSCASFICCNNGCPTGHCHFCPIAGVIFALRLESSVWGEHAVMSTESYILMHMGRREIHFGNVIITSCSSYFLKASVCKFN